jgi:hypothetical protein
MLPSLICWHLWLERNLVIFENGRASTTSVFHRIRAWLGLSKVLLQPTIAEKSPPSIIEGFPVGWFDGAAQGRGQFSGAGGIIRVNRHTIFKWMLNCGPGSNTRAELLGVWTLLTLATRLHIYDLQVFGDSKIVIDWLNHNCALQVCDLLCWQDRIQTLLKDFLIAAFHPYLQDL